MTEPGPQGAVPYPDEPDAAGPGADRIVAGVDGSPATARALRWALAEARRSGATVEAVHAYEVPAYQGQPVEWVLDWVRADAGALLDRVVEAAAVDYPGVPVRRSVRRGPPGMALVKAAAGARLLVVGPRSRAPLAELPLGSVAQHCATRAPCPVVVLPPGDRTAADRPATRAAARDDRP